jgi:hypothetical protein
VLVDVADELIERLTFKLDVTVDDANAMHPTKRLDQLTPNSSHHSFRNTIIALVVIQDVEELAARYMFQN